MHDRNMDAWERLQRDSLNIYPRSPQVAMAPPARPRWTVGGILTIVAMVAMGGLVMWGAWDDVAEHAKPVQPVAQVEKPVDITGQIRTLERMIAEVKQLNADLQELHKQLTK